MEFTTGKYKGDIIAKCNDYSYLCMVKQHGGWKSFTREQMIAVDQRVTELIHEKWVERGMGEMVDGEFVYHSPKKEIEINITKRIAWINEREPLSEYAKELIEFQMKDAVIEALKGNQRIIK